MLSAPLLPRSGGEGSGVGGPQQARCHRSKRRRPPPPTPSRHAQGRVGGGEITEHGFAISLNNRHCERQRSNPLAAANEASEEWIASSQVLLAMTSGHGFAISPNAFFARYSFIPALSELRAQGMPGARCAHGLVCNGSGRAHTSIQVTPESPGIPHAMVYGLYRALPGARLSDSHISKRDSFSIG
jgi:hypothetical protein